MTGEECRVELIVSVLPVVVWRVAVSRVASVMLTVCAPWSIRTQLYSSDGGAATTLLLLVNLKANAKETIAFQFKPAGKGDNTSEAGMPLVFGREATIYYMIDSQAPTALSP